MRSRVCLVGELVQCWDIQKNKTQDVLVILHTGHVPLPPGSISIFYLSCEVIAELDLPKCLVPVVFPCTFVHTKFWTHLA